MGLRRKKMTKIFMSIWQDFMRKLIIIVFLFVFGLGLLITIDLFTIGHSLDFFEKHFFPPKVDIGWKKHEAAEYITYFSLGMTPEAKARTILKKMTLDEKIRYLSGYKYFGTTPIPRLDIPPVWFADATSGIRRGLATAYPASIALTASWNRQMIRKVARAIAEEARAKGISVILGPGVNIYRVPTCGRNFEYMGEDPFLAGAMAVSYIQGMQSRQVIATIKHFVANNSEYDRHRISSDVDERTLREIYFPAFKAAVVQGQVGAVMTSYNPVNGIYTSEHPFLLDHVLRGQWNYSGFVMSDWTSVYSVLGTVKHGVDIEMPAGRFLNNKKIMPLIKKKFLTIKHVDKKVFRMLRTFFAFGVLERSVVDERYKVHDKEHRRIALQSAREGIVLLKNENHLLPLHKKRYLKSKSDKLAATRKKNIVVIGPQAKGTEIIGGGAGEVFPQKRVDIWQGLRQAAKKRFRIRYARHLGPWVVDRKLVQNANAVLVCVGFGRDRESETFDRSWSLPFGQEGLIQNVRDLNPNTVVILVTGSGVKTNPWIQRIPAVIHGMYLGQFAGQALAEVVFGLVNPSGKLPFTMAKKWNDIEAVKNYVSIPWLKNPFRIFPEKKSRDEFTISHMPYKEKLMIGYRHFDTNKIEPQFAFGYGLSYTSFKISQLALSKQEILITPAMKKNKQWDELIAGYIRDDEKVLPKIYLTGKIKNTGYYKGAEVIQLYIRDIQASATRPMKELKGFRKVFLHPSQEKKFSISISLKDFAFYDPTQKKWRIEPGEYLVLAGTSSRDIFYKKKFVLR